MEELTKILRQCLDEIDAGIKEGKFPEVARIYVERLGRSIRNTLSVIETVLKENTIQTGISPSSRSAIYNLRRAFYANLSRLVEEEGVDKDRSTEEWKSAVSKMIEFINKEGISETPMKIVLTYSIAEEGDKKFVRPEKAEILFFELEGVRTVKF
ncbi:MAG: hypothetical protein DRJ41_02575 [Thermoprotei archaeon]|nr:MAG: hypothetical protein DRJ41_02575 [Thermoprotei archaeon]